MQHHKRHNVIVRCEWYNNNIRNPDRPIFTAQGLMPNAVDNPALVRITAVYPNDRKLNTIKRGKYYLLKNVVCDFYSSTQEKVLRVNSLSAEIEEVENLQNYGLRETNFRWNFTKISSRITKNYSSPNLSSALVAGKLVSLPVFIASPVPRWSFSIANEKDEQIDINSWTKSNPLKKAKIDDVLIFTKLLRKPWSGGVSFSVAGAIYKTAWKWKATNLKKMNNLSTLQLSEAQCLVLYIYIFFSA